MSIAGGQTIAAAATGMTEAGIGIIRISGEEAVAIGNRLFADGKMRRDRLKNFQAGTIHFGYILDPFNDDEVVDEVMVSVMLSPHSYTTEDTVEINSHGGMFVMNRILQIVLASGARLAEPGEFTKRAFLGGRIDLARAEAVMDLISSQNEFARKTSVAQLGGAVSEKVRNMRHEILYEIARIESALDDPENYSLDGYGDELFAKTEKIEKEIDALLRNTEDGMILKDGIRTVIVGKPNAGKSSLLNLLTGTDRAIVTDVAGTTRDTLQESVRIGDVQLNLIDTAGIRETSDKVEQIGIRKAMEAVDQADLILFLLDLSDRFSDDDRAIAEALRGYLGNDSSEDGEKLSPSASKKCIVLLNKADAAVSGDIAADSDNISKNNSSADTVVPDESRNDNSINDVTQEQTAVADQMASAVREVLKADEELPVIVCSMITGQGLPELREEISRMFRVGELIASGEVMVTSMRHKEALLAAKKALLLVRDSINSGMSEDFYSIDLMSAYSELGKIIGEQVEDDLVEEIFARFCLGK